MSGEPYSRAQTRTAAYRVSPSDAERWAANRRYRAEWPPSEKQLCFIGVLYDELDAAARETPSTRKAAAQLIARLLALKRRERRAMSRRSKPR